MKDHMNPAERLLALYEKLVRQTTDQQMVKTWAVVFDLDPTGPALEDEVNACVVALRAQVDFTRTRLDEHGVPSNLTDPGFTRLRSVAAPALFHQSWNGHRGNIQAPECRHAFQWAAWVLRDESEQEVPPDELKGLLNEVLDLEQALRDADMSPYLRSFIQRQIDAIHSALRVYPVSGVRPLREAMTSVVGAITIEDERLVAANNTAPPDAQTVLAKASSFIHKTAGVCDNIDKIYSFGEKAVSLTTKLAPLLSYVT